MSHAGLILGLPELEVERVDLNDGLFIINGGHRGSLDCFCGNGLMENTRCPTQD